MRASTPMYLLARVIKSMGVKMVLSGEGADEVFGGYLYFHKPPTPALSTRRPCARSASCTSTTACGPTIALRVGGRRPRAVPRQGVSRRGDAHQPGGENGQGRAYREVDSAQGVRRPPSPEIVWRQKEQFSDGVGYGWIDTLKRITSEAVSDREMAQAADRFPVNPPRNKEEYYYRTIFAPAARGTRCSRATLRRSARRP